LRQYDGGRFANVLGYHASYFRAQSYWQLAQSKYTTADAKAKGMGEAVTYLRVAVAKFEEGKGFVSVIGGAYKANFDKKLAEAVALRDKAHKENQKVYYDPESKPADLTKPNAQNFVNMVAMTEEMNAVPEMDGKLRHLVPPQVRAMNDELKNVLQGIITAEFTKI